MPSVGGTLTSDYDIASDGAGRVWVVANVISAAAGFSVQVADLGPATALVGARPAWYLVETGVQAYQISPSIELRPDGKAVVVWTEILINVNPSDLSALVTDGNVRAIVLGPLPSTSTGVFSVNNLDYGAGLFFNAIVVRPDNSFTVIWDGYTRAGGESPEIIGQNFSATGVKQGSPTIVNNAVTGTQFGAEAVGLAGGGMVIVWQDGNVVDQANVRMQVYDAAGSGPIRNVAVHANLAGDQTDPDVVALADGSFVVVWTDDAGTLLDPSTGVQGQRFSATGVPMGEVFQINTTLAGIQDGASITAVGNRLLIAWQDANPGGFDPDGEDIAVQILDVPGPRLDTLATEAFELIQIETTPDGKLQVAVRLDNVADPIQGIFRFEIDDIDEMGTTQPSYSEYFTWPPLTPDTPTSFRLANGDTFIVAANSPETSGHFDQSLWVLYQRYGTPANLLRDFASNASQTTIAGYSRDSTCNYCRHCFNERRQICFHDPRAGNVLAPVV